jgi:hypothetical protein
MMPLLLTLALVPLLLMCRLRHCRTGTVVWFTIFWTQRNIWEGRDFQIDVTPS